MLRKFFAIVLCLCTLITNAYCEEFCGCYGYEILPDGSVSVTSYTEEGATSLSLPATLDGRAVTKLGDYAFAYSSLESVTLPEGITEIGACAFNACYQLREISLPSTLRIIRADAFLCCISLEELTFPKGLQCIEDEAFYNCQSLRRADVPAGTQLGVRVFEACDHLGLSEP